LLHGLFTLLIIASTGKSNTARRNTVKVLLAPKEGSQKKALQTSRQNRCNRCWHLATQGTKEEHAPVSHEATKPGQHEPAKPCSITPCNRMCASFDVALRAHLLLPQPKQPKAAEAQSRPPGCHHDDQHQHDTAWCNPPQH
jgi:hypothetical protein